MVAAEGVERLRERAIRPRGAHVIKTPKDAERFLDRVCLALRYGPGKNLPLASMFDATSGGSADGPFVSAAELTNHLLGTATAIEVSVIAGRLTLVHRSAIPALYALVRRGRPIEDLTGLSLNARRAFALLQNRREVTVGDVRAFLGGAREARDDPGQAALGELARSFLVDRGPYEINQKGIHYLSREGYPHHLFHAAHDDLVSAARKLRVADAADAFLKRYLTGAVFCAVRTMKSMFKQFLVAEEIDASLSRLADGGHLSIQKVGGQTAAVAGGLARRSLVY